jgi:hypothetical protein
VADSDAPATPHVKKGRGPGFRGMTPARHRQVSSKGGKSAHRQHLAHQFTPAEARVAGRKGARAKHANERRRKAETAAAKGER